MKRGFCFQLCLPIIAALVFAPLAFGQAGDRGTITGLVMDSSGAAVPDATVTATNDATGVKTTVASDAAGNYATPPLILGTYTLQVEKAGFKTFVRPGIILTSGHTYRQDVTLELGAITQTVEVKAASVMINSESAEVSHTLTESYYNDLPAVMGAVIRLAESMLQIQPGYIPMAPNGDAIFRGSQFQSRINGGQTMSTENYFDGAAFGYAEGHQQTQESSLPYESVKEMKVLENNFSAQYGHTSGGFVQYTTKSGTNEFHGDIYDYLTSGKTNARNFFLPDVLPLTQNNWGFSLGGPVWIPKVYDGHKRTFFFVNLDGLDYHSIVNTGFVNTLPLAAARNGDFSALLTNNQIGTDALGRPIFQGQIFNPATTRVVNGVVVRDPYPGNIIPANDPLRSAIAAKLVPLIPQPDRQTLINNEYGGTSDDNNKINVRTWLLRGDHTFNDKFRMSNTWYTNNRPRIAHCGGPGGCDVPNDPATSPGKNDTYIGQGFFQLITNHYDHLQFDYIVKPNVFNHTTIAYDRWVMGGNSLSAKVGWNSKLGITTPGIDPTAGPPGIGFGGTIPYTALGNSWANGREVNNRWQFLDDLTWIKGKHTIKVGFEYRAMNFPQQGWAVQTGGNYNFNAVETGAFDHTGSYLTQTGDAFASFLLGQVDNAYFNIQNYYTPRQMYTAPWINDDIKVTPKLTLSLGLRFDYQSGLSESHNRFSTFDPTAPNPAAGGIPGAIVFASPSRRAFEDPGWNTGPRFGFAYQIVPNTVIRGGYGMYYSGVAASQWMGYPVTGFTTNPTAANVTGGVYPAFYWDSSCTTSGPGNVPCGFPSSAIVFPPIKTPDFANGTSPITVNKNAATLPRYQNWSVSIQHQFGANMALDVAYVGNHGTRLVDSWQTNGVLANMLNPAMLTQYGPALLLSPASSPQAQQAGIKLPYPTFTGDVAQALRLWPQYQNILYRNAPNGMSSYNAIQASFERRMSEGLQFRVAYTWSRLYNNGAEAGQSGQTGGQFGQSAAIQNPVNLRGEWGLSVDDVPNYLGIAWIYELPFGHGKKWGSSVSGAANKLIGGWKISATQIYQSGRPLIITMNNDMGNLIFNPYKRPNKVGPGVNPNFKDPSTPYLLLSGWADPGPLTFGTSPRTTGAIRGFGYYNEDLNIFKDTLLTERVGLRFEAMAGNLFNRVDFCNPNLNWSVPQFGTVNSQCNIPRRIQFGLTLRF